MNLSRLNFNLVSLTSLGLVVTALGFSQMWYPSTKPLPVTTTSNTNFNFLPLNFERNDGQTAKQVSYLSRGSGYVLFFTPQELVLDFRAASLTKDPQGNLQSKDAKTSTDVLRVQFVGANQHPNIVGKEMTQGKSNYFIGNDPKNWHRNIPNYGRVNYQHLYSGIDMTFYGNQNRLEYDIRVMPGANPATARFHFEGAKDLHLNAKGDLIVTTSAGSEVNMHNPIIYQTIHGIKHSIVGSFRLYANKEVGFNVGTYDKTQPLVIDPVLTTVPVLTMSTFLGGSGGQNGVLSMQLTDEPLPTLYMSGHTSTTDFPVMGAYQNTNRGKGRTAFITKYDRNSNSLVYSTYLGGTGGYDESLAITVDSVHSAYVAGRTNSNDFPLQGPYQATNKGAKNYTAFITKLNPEGNGLVYSTYLGGTGDKQEVNSIAVDGDGYAYVTGETSSKDFPMVNAFQPTHKGTHLTCYIAKLNTLGNNLVFSTYLGGSGAQDEGNSIAIDSDNAIYVTGQTDAKDFPVVNALQPQPKAKGASWTGFITKMAPDGQSLVWSTYLGGSGGTDYPKALDLDDLENVYVVGYTNSSDFPVVNPVQATNNGPNITGFLTKIQADGSAIVYSTYLGGSGGNDRLNAVSVDPERKPHFCGATNSHDIPLRNAVQSVNRGTGITIMAGSLMADGTLNNSTYFGGSGGNDACFAVKMDAVTNAYLAGNTNSIDFPVYNATKPVKTSQIEAFFANFSL